jgi:acyl-CoA synthetase (AMP-forming)/AMP-acid ligase II
MEPPFVSVSQHLRRRAAAAPASPALHLPARPVRPTGTTPHRTVTFAQLDADADALAHGLAAAGLAAGSRVAVMVPPGADFFALTFALLRRRAVPVLLDPGMGVAGLGRCLDEAAPAGFIGVPKAHLARHLFGWLRGRKLVTVTVGRHRLTARFGTRRLRLLGGGFGPWLDDAVGPDDPAAVLFTSGSTGPAKGAVYTHGIFAAQIELLKATYGIEPGEVDLCTFPLFALFGPALGMACVVPDMDASRPATLDPRKAVAQVRQFDVTNLFGSPAVIRRLADHGEPLPTLRRAISAGAPASAPAVEAFAKLLPDGVELFTPYGATEALPVANIGSREILAETRALTEQGKGVCVGRPVPGLTIHVVRISDGPMPVWDASLQVPAGEVGEIVVRGPVVTRGYFNRPAADELAKMHDPATGQVLHRMGDVGYMDEHGRLWFCGRKSHRVETPHGTLFTDMVEPVYNAEYDGGRTALVGVARRGVTHPVLCYEYTGRRTGHHRVEDLLAERGKLFAHTRRVVTFLPHPGPFPVDVRHNSKIFRERLAAWADQQIARDWGGPA